MLAKFKSLSLTNAVRIFLYTSLAIALLSLTGCQAIAGLGRDMQKAAEWTQNGLENGFHRERRN